MTENYLKSSILSNSEFYYRDNQILLPESKRIPLTIELEKKADERHNIPVKHMKRALSMKEIFIDYPESAFERAKMEEVKTRELLKQKKESTEKKAAIIDHIVALKEKEIKEKEIKEKEDLERALVVIIKDALNFSKSNNPMLSMMPEKLINSINQLREEKGFRRTSNFNNMTGASLNVSFKSSKSNSSVAKYESNAFLKALGLDLNGLSPDNIKIDINKAYEFIRKWKVSSKEEIKKIIRYKVVKEIMNVEERRSVQKLAKINKKISMYFEEKKKSSKSKSKEKKKMVKSKSLLEFAKPQTNSFNKLEKKKDINNKDMKEEVKVESKAKIEEEKTDLKNDEKKEEKKENIDKPEGGIGDSNKSHPKKETKVQIKTEKREESKEILKKETKKVTIKGVGRPGEKIEESNDAVIVEQQKEILVKHQSQKEEDENKEEENDMEENKQKNSYRKEDEAMSMSSNNSNSVKENKEEKHLKTITSVNKIMPTAGGRTDITGVTKKTGDPGFRREKQKQRVVYNSYKNADKICRLINTNDRLKQNEALVKHFNNIKYNKKFDRVKNSILSQQQIVLNKNYDPILHLNLETQVDNKIKTTKTTKL